MSTERPPQEPSDRVKQDIEEVLRSMDERDEAEPEPMPVSVPRKPRVVRPKSGRGLQPGMLMAIGAVLLLLAIVFSPLRLSLAVAGLLLLATGYWMSWRSSRPGKQSRQANRDGVRYWRGQRIEYGQPETRRGNVVQFRETWRGRLRRWLRGR